MSERSEQLRIRTPEGVTFGLPLAGPVSRALAWGVDAMAVIAATALLAKFLALFSLINEDFGIAIMLLSFFALSIGYRICLEWFWRGQTLGNYQEARTRRVHMTLDNYLRD